MEPGTVVTKLSSFTSTKDFLWTLPRGWGSGAYLKKYMTVAAVVAKDKAAAFVQSPYCFICSKGRQAADIEKKMLGAVRHVIFNKDVFPTTFSLFIFVVYMALFISQGLLVTASRRGGATYPYNPTTVVLLTELLKMVMAMALYTKDHSVSVLTNEISKSRWMMPYYMVPAFLYCLYNNLSFTNLAIFDPTSYFMFLQLRLLMTGVIYQCLFSRRLSRLQWLSLVFVTIGCVIQRIDLLKLPSFPPSMRLLDNTTVMTTNTTVKDSGVQWQVVSVTSGFLLILAQVCSSVFASVYNEYLIKRVAGAEVDIMVQNVFMYLNSIICNVIVLVMKGDLVIAFSHEALASIVQTFVLLIIVNNGFTGIVTSLFLQNLNSILKAIASACELVFTPIFAFLLLRIPFYWNTVVAVAIVSYAIVLYSKNPVKEEVKKAPEVSRKMSASRKVSAHEVEDELLEMRDDKELV